MTTKKAVNTFVIIGRKIVATEARADNTVRDELIACLEYSPADLVHVVVGVKEGYKKRLDSLMTSQDWMIAEDKNVRQAIYNRQSEKLAILAAFSTAHTFNNNERQLFRDACYAAHGYHNLVTLCRSFNTTGDVSATTKKAKPFKISAYIKAIKATSDVAALVELRTELDRRIKMLQHKAPVASIAKARKARAAKVKAAQQTNAAVNPQHAAA